MNAEIQGFRFFQDPAVGPNGELYVGWNELGSQQSGIEGVMDILVRVDSDGLFANSHDFDDLPASTINSTLDLLRSEAPAARARGVHVGTVLDVDRSGGEYSGRLYATWVNAIEGEFAINDDSKNDTEVFVAYSVDNGATWEDPVGLGDLAGADSSDTDFLPWVDVDQTTGSVSVIYYTTEGQDPPNTEDEYQPVAVYLATSTDGGDSFTTAVISNSDTTPGDFETDYLEYIGLAVHDGTAHGLWASTDLGDGQNLEAVTASVSFESITGGNRLIVTGDDNGPSNEHIDIDLIQVGTPATSFVRVMVNGEIQFTGLADTIDEIIVNGMTGFDFPDVDQAVLNLIPTTIVDTPHVVAVELSSSVSGNNDGVYPIPSGDGSQIKSVPVGAVDTISIVFSDQIMPFSVDPLTVTSAINQTVYAMSPPVLDAFGTRATWQLQSGSFGADQLVIHLDGTTANGVKGATGAMTGKLLDGDWISPTKVDDTRLNRDNKVISRFPSGDGIEGGDFEFSMTVFPVDFDTSNVYDFLDISTLSAGISNGGDEFIPGLFTSRVANR